MFYDVILLNASLETEYRCKTTDFLWHSKLCSPGEFQIQIVADDDLDLTVCKYVTVNTKKEIGIIHKATFSSTEPGTAILSGYFLEHLLYESVLYPTYNASNKTIWQVGAEVCSTYLNDLGFPLVLPSQPSSGVIVSESLSVTKEQTGDYVGTLLYDLAAVFGYGVSLSNRLSATNLITNGDFSDGKTGWSALFGVISATGDVLSLTASAQYGRSQATLPSSCQGHKVYRAAMIKANSPLVYLGRGSGLGKAHSGGGSYEHLSFMQSSENVLATSIIDMRTSGWDLINVKYVISIDLTDTFGEGNEPTAEQMDALMAQFPNSWFGGAVEVPSFVPTLKADITNYHDRTGTTADEEKVFSVGLNSIKKYDVVKDGSNYRNVAVVAGEGEGSARVFEIVDIAETGEQKRHLWVDARDLQQEEGESITDYRLKLRQRGLEKLAETVEIENVEIEIEDDEAQLIGTEYDIGDIVWVIINPIKASYKMKIIEVEDVVNQGKRSTSLIFGDKIPTPWEKVKRFYR